MKLNTRNPLMSRARRGSVGAFLALAVMLSAFALVSATDSVDAKGKPGGTTIQDGTLEYSAGHYLAGTPLVLGFDPYGYNYQGHMFSGSYANAYLGRAGAAYPPYEGDDVAYLAANTGAAGHWAWPYRDVRLDMKWNEAWLSNMDRGGDGTSNLGVPDSKLDRYYGFDSYRGSGAWLTNHMRGEYEDAGNVCKWTYFVKIVAAPADATAELGIWYAANGAEIGPVIWGSFAIVQEVSNDACAGDHGIQYLSPNAPGFGVYAP